MKKGQKDIDADADDTEYYHSQLEDYNEIKDYFVQDDDDYVSLDYTGEQADDKNDNKSIDVRGIITFNGWEFFRSHDNSYHCCYKYENNRRSTSPMLKKNVFDLTFLKIINAIQVVCPLVPGNDLSPYASSETPIEVALSKTKVCRDTKQGRIKFIKLVKKTVSSKGNNSIAICSKIIYNHYPPSRLIEWFEFNKLMGVDKVMMFRYNVSKEGDIVLDYYEKTGFLETVEYDYPMKSKF